MYEKSEELKGGISPCCFGGKNRKSGITDQRQNNKVSHDVQSG